MVSLIIGIKRNIKEVRRYCFIDKVNFNFLDFLKGVDIKDQIRSLSRRVV